ncbi:MAG: tetratricopeptide repeat protein [Bacteroidales bacterium]|nr:tetratricopeptide repeat protein [Bacteroidales bacterium]
MHNKDSAALNHEINKSSSSSNLLSLAKHFFDEGERFKKEGDDSIALVYFSDCYDLCKKNPSLSNRAVGVLMSIADIYKERGQLIRAIECYKKCFHDLEKGSFIKRAAILNNLGNIYFIQGALDSSETYFNKSLLYYEELLDSSSMSVIYNNIGNIAFQKGNYEFALKSYLISIKIKEQFDNKRGAGLTYSNIASVYEKMNRPLKALEYYRYGYQLDSVVGNQEGCAADLVNMGNVYLSEEQFEEALSYFNKAITISSKIQYDYGLANCLEGISLVYSAKQNFDSALVYINKAILYKEKTGRPSELANSYNNLGTLQFYNNQYSEAISSYNKSIELAQEAGDVEKVKRALSGLHESYAEIENYENAYNELLEYLILKDSIGSIVKSKQIFELQEKYESEKKEQQIRIQKLEIKRKEGQRNLSLALTIFVLLTAFFITWLVVQKKRKVQLFFEKEKELQEHQLMQLVQESEIKSSRMMIEGQELEKERVSKELHDRVGGLLSLLKLRFTACRDFIQKDKEASFNESIQLLDTTYHEVRNFSHELSSALISKFGLSVALKEMQNVINRSGTMTLNLTINDKQVQRDRFLELALYRIIQELISNVLKHAKATCIEVLININQNENWEVVIEDNGVGFDYQEDSTNGLGLASVRERVEHLKAKINIVSVKHKGTKVQILKRF